MAERSNGRKRRAHLALFDAMTLTAKGVKEHLVARSFPTKSVRLFSSDYDAESKLSDFAGEAILVTTPDIDALGQLDIAFLCGTRHDGERYLDWAAKKNFVAIDLTTASSEREEVPLINATVNPEAIPAKPALIASPRPASQFLSSLLAPIQRGCELLDATAVVFQPASECGDSGIEELYQQTLGLLNFRDIPKGTFGRQLAFNLIPGDLYGTGGIPGGDVPADIEREVRGVTGGDYGLSVEVTLAPVFHCHTALLHVTLGPGCTVRDLEDCFRSSEEVHRHPEGTPVERAGKPGIAVSVIRPGGTSSTFWIWAITDNMQTGAALNAVRIAEAILDRGRTGRVA